MILWTANRAGAVVIDWQGEAAGSDSAELSTILEKRWFEWETRYRVLPRPLTVRVSVVSRDQRQSRSPLQHDWAWSKDQDIFLNPKILGKRKNEQGFFLGILEHEMAHQFLSHYASPAQKNIFIQECFAYYVTGDFRRIFSHLLETDSDSVFTFKALEYFRLHRKTLSQDRELARPLSRLLVEAVDKSPKRGNALEKYYQNLFSKTPENDWNMAELEDGLFGLLTGISESAPAYNQAEGFLLIDGPSRMPLAQAGDVDTAQMPGSLLKPLFLKSVPALKKSRLARRHESWACEVGGTEKNWIRKWTWQEALAKSCNGFFIDQVKVGNSDWVAYRQSLHALSPRFDGIGKLTPAHAIGLLPKIELTPREILQLYLQLNSDAPDIIDALGETVRTGTLANRPDSPWFIEQGLYMKTGTIRDISSQPMLGWIVVMKREPLARTPSWIAVYYKKGKAPVEMLGGLRQLLQAYVGTQAEKVRVQILGLVPQQQIRIQCRAPALNIPLAEMKEGARLSCGGGPFQLEFPDKTGALIQRSYYGDLLKTKMPTSALYKLGTEKQAKARRGSVLQLETSMLAYTSHVLISEMAQGRTETLKALALAIQQNARTHPTHQDAICDTTHCQVFATHWDGQSLGLRKKVIDLVLSIQKDRLLSWKESHQQNSRAESAKKSRESQENWFPFSLGGLSRWTDFKTRKEIETELHLGSFDKIELQAEKVSLSNQGVNVGTFTCEEFRNQMHLLSCPEEIQAEQERWIFSGKGAGHQRGLDLSQADLMAAQGATYRQILRSSYPGLKARFH